MAYQALYRQWRPQTFAEFAGQEHVIQTLQNALEQGRVAHAYLFCGSRGTGKTSAAKILAKAVNCERGPAREPCNVCPACTGIQEGRVIDVLEIDAASNRGIDEIRELREKVRYAPVEVRRKVYIIDEVHMLTMEACNALLKTLEEPPGQALFILATTEPHKLPVTIISRCQRLDFRLIPPEAIRERLREVLTANGRECGEDALQLLAEEAAGSLRDGLSLLEQVLAYTSGAVTVEDVLSVLGAVSRDVFSHLTDALLQDNLAEALLILQDVAASGKDFAHFTQQAIAYYRDLMVVAACGQEAQQLGVAQNWVGNLKRQAAALGLAEIGRILSILHELRGELRWTQRPRLSWELALFNMFVPPGREAPSHIQNRTEELLPAVREQAAAYTGREAGKTVRQGQSAADFGSKVLKLWPRILEDVKQASVKTHAVLLAAEPGSGKDNVLEICFSSQFHCDMMQEAENIKVLQQAVERRTGVRPKIRCLVQGDSGQTATPRQDPEEIIHSALEIFDGQLIDESGKI
ncbi:MAG TPA: DNA polymerase III subunit gamma/tau [Firmicutes bacterium]|nr:DNA polymerase III subunit gamma/tau [Bacillota bacterium]